MTPRVEALSHLESSYPLAVFVEWAERVPEFRDALAVHGLGWGGRGTASVGDDRRAVAPTELPPGEQVDFRANIGGRWHNVRLFGVVGHVIKVRVEGEPVANITAIQMGQVSPVDVERVERAIAKLPQSKEEVFWEEDERPAIPLPEGMEVLPLPMPPPGKEDGFKDL